MIEGSNEFVEFVGFEGTEKKIEVSFREDPQNPYGLRGITSEQWQAEILDMIHCTIIGQKSNNYFDAYVLSESSLFVYPFKVILKTCGTTTLLNSIEPLIELACKRYRLEPEFVFFSRKNFKFPERQLFPHQSVEEEIRELDRVFPGHMYTFGPHTDEHWVLYCAEMCNSDSPTIHNDQTLEILMEDLDRDIMRFFYKDDDFISADQTAEITGISEILPGSVIDAIHFDPCGYSCNGLLDESYFTIHITPEPECSYVSFETNVAFENYTGLIQKVLEVFKPGKFAVTLFADEGSKSGPTTLNGFDAIALEKCGFKTLHQSFAGWHDSYNYSLHYAAYKSMHSEESKCSRKSKRRIYASTEVY